jgi:hypothetical protein
MPSFQLTYSFLSFFRASDSELKIAVRRCAAFSSNFVSQRPEIDFKMQSKF